MNQLNSLIIEGNCVEKATISEPKAGFKVCKFSVGVNRLFKNQNGEEVNEVSYFDAECYGKLAEMCEGRLEKGKGVRIVGRMKQDRWTDKTGKTLSRVFIVCEHIEFKRSFPAAKTA